MLDYGAMESVLSRVLKGKVDFADIYAEDTVRSSFRLDDERVDVVSGGSDQGVGLRAIAGDTIIYAHTSDISLEGLGKLADEALAALTTRDTGVFTLRLSPPVSAERLAVRAPNQVPAKDKVDLLWRADQAARSHDVSVSQVTASYVDSIKSFRLLNSIGQQIDESRTYTRFMVQVVATRNGIMQTGFEAPGQQSGFELFDDVSPEEIAILAAGRAILMLDAEVAPTGTMPVVLGPGSGGVIFHEAVGHGLEGDHIEKGSVYSGQKGSKVASGAVTLIDDSTIEGLWGSYRYDDEGEPSRRRVLIDKGTLTGYLCDRYWGRRLSVGSTGSGRRESYANLPIARMSNTYLQPGEATHEDIVSATSTGIFAKKLGGGQVDPQTGDFMFSVSEGYLIKNGKIAGPVRGATLTGNGPQILNRIDLVGNDLDFDPGTCGKDGQGVPVCIGQPTCRVTEMTVGGTSMGGTS